MATKTTQKPPRLPFVGEGTHKADERRFDPLAKQSWCVCGQFYWPHDLIKHRLPQGYRHLECSSLSAAGIYCTREIGQHREGSHSARVGNSVDGWRVVSWPGQIYSSQGERSSGHP